MSDFHLLILYVVLHYICKKKLSGRMKQKPNVRPCKPTDITKSGDFNFNFTDVDDIVTGVI